MAFGIQQANIFDAAQKGRKAGLNELYKNTLMKSTVAAQELNEKKFERQRKQQDVQSLFKFSFKPSIDELLKSGSQEDVDAFTSGFVKDHPVIEETFGKNLKVFKGGEEGPSFEVDYTLTNDDIQSLPGLTPSQKQQLLEQNPEGIKSRLKRNANTGEIQIDDITREAQKQLADLEKKKRAGTGAKGFSATNITSIFKETKDLKETDETIRALRKIQAGTFTPEEEKDLSESVKKELDKDDGISLIQKLRNFIDKTSVASVIADSSEEEPATETTEPTSPEGEKTIASLEKRTNRTLTPIQREKAIQLGYK